MELLLFLLLPVAAFSGWLTGRKSSTSKKSKRYFAGIDYSLSQQPDKTVDTLVQMPTIDDDTIETHLTLGIIFRRRGELQRALRLHQSLLERPTLADPYKSLAHLELARDYIAAGVLDRAEAILLELIEHNEQLVPSLQHLLELYQQGKEWIAAIKIAQRLQKEKRIDYSSVIAHYYCELAEQAVKNQQISDAEHYLQQATKVQTDCLRAIMLQASLRQSFDHSGIAVHNILEQNRTANKFRCSNCGFVTSKLEWNCPSCKQWDMIKPLQRNVV